MKEFVLTHLLKLKTEVENGIYPEFGICWYINECLSNSQFDPDEHVYIYKILNELFRAWSEFSGLITYPVPCNGGAPQAFYNLNRWEGEYGESRKRLLDFMIQQLLFPETKQSPTI